MDNSYQFCIVFNTKCHIYYWGTINIFCTILLILSLKTKLRVKKPDRMNQKRSSTRNLPSVFYSKTIKIHNNSSSITTTDCFKKNNPVLQRFLELIADGTVDNLCFKQTNRPTNINSKSFLDKNELLLIIQISTKNSLSSWLIDIPFNYYVSLFNY